MLLWPPGIWLYSVPSTCQCGLNTSNSPGSICLLIIVPGLHLWSTLVPPCSEAFDCLHWTGSGFLTIWHTGIPRRMSPSEIWPNKLFCVGFYSSREPWQTISGEIRHFWLNGLFKDSVLVNGRSALLLSDSALADAVIHPCRIEPTSFQTHVKAELHTTSFLASDSQCNLLTGLMGSIPWLCCYA